MVLKLDRFLWVSVGLFSLIVSCKRVPDWEMRSDRPETQGMLQQWPQFQRWLWTCRAEVGRVPDQDEIPVTGIAIAQFLDEYRKSGLTVIDALGTKQLLGTAVLWSQDGLLVTLDHWLQSASAIECRNSESDWQSAVAINRDVDLNIALLKIPPSAAKKGIRFGAWPKTDTVSVNDELYAIAAPYPGMVERIPVQLNSLKGSLQTGIDENLHLFSPVPPSHMGGGVLVNAKGEFVGFLHSKRKTIWGKAISSRLLDETIQELQAKGEIRRLYLGMILRWVPGGGFIVQEVEVEGVAYKAGVRLGDIILSWDGRKLTEASDWPSLKLSDLGSEVDIGLLRSNKEVQIKLSVKSSNR